MSRLLDWNLRLGEFISSKIKGGIGLFLHALLVSIIVLLLAFLLYWIIKLVLASLVWLVPIFLVVLAVAAIIYLISSVKYLYK